MRDIREGNCPLCDHDEIIEAVPGEFADGHQEVVAAVAYDARWLGGGRNPRHPHGRLLLYVCRRCGFAQTFAEQPADVPIGEEFLTRLVKGRPPGRGYR